MSDSTMEPGTQKNKSFVVTWLLASLFFAYQYALRILPPTLSHELLSHFKMNSVLFGKFGGMYYLAYVVAHIPMGLILDRLGLRIVLSVCVLTAAISQLSLVLTHDFNIALIGRVLTGIASSAGIVAVVKTVTLAYKVENFPFMLGLSITIGVCGSIGSSFFLPSINVLLGFEQTVYLVAAVGVVLGLFVMIATPSNHGVIAVKKGGWLRDVKTLFAADRIWILVAILGGLMVGVMEGFSDAWSVSFLTKTYGLTTSDAAKMASVMFFAFAIGAPIVGFIDRKFQMNQLIFLSILGLLSCISFSLIIFPQDTSNLVLLFVMLMINGSCFAYQSLILSQAILRLPKSITALSAASANMIMMGFGFIYHLAIGYSMENHWDGTMGKDGVPEYSVEAYSSALSVISYGTATAALCFILLFLYTKKKGWV